MRRKRGNKRRGRAGKRVNRYRMSRGGIRL